MNGQWTVTEMMTPLDEELWMCLFTNDQISHLWFHIFIFCFLCSGLLSNLRSLITRLTGPKYKSAPLETILKEVVGDLKLTETVKPIIIPSYDINYQSSVLFSTTQVINYSLRSLFHTTGICTFTISWNDWLRMFSLQ